MRAVLGLATSALLLGTVAVASGQTVETGTVVRIDPQSGIITLADGRMYRVTPSTVIVVDNRPVHITALRPGAQVVIQSGETVAPVTATPAGFRQTIYGRVKEVEPNGEVTIRVQGDTFEVKLNPGVQHQVRDGDTVTIELTFTPPGAPAASPR